MITLPGRIRRISWWEAFAAAASWVCALILIEGGILLLRGSDLDGAAARTSVTDFAWDDRRQVGVATIWTSTPRAVSSLEFSAIRIAPAEPHSHLCRVWRDLKPRNVLSIGPDGQLAVANSDGSLMLRSAADADALESLIGRHPDGDPEYWCCSGDGALLVSKGSNYLCAWDVARKELLWVTAASPIEGIAMHPTKACLLCGRADGVLEQRDARTGEVLHQSRFDEAPISYLVISPHGQRVAAIRGSENLTVWQLETGERLWSARLVAATARSLSISPDGKWLALGALSSRGGWRVMRFDVASGCKLTSPEVTGVIHGTRFTTENHLFYWGADGRLRRCDEQLNEVAQWTPGR